MDRIWNLNSTDISGGGKRIVIAQTFHMRMTAESSGNFCFYTWTYTRFGMVRKKGAVSIEMINEKKLSCLSIQFKNPFSFNFRSQFTVLCMLQCKHCCILPFLSVQWLKLKTCDLDNCGRTICENEHSSMEFLVCSNANEILMRAPTHRCDESLKLPLALVMYVRKVK